MKTWSIKTRVALSATLFCIALIALVGVLQMHFMRKDLRNVIADQQFTLVSRVAEDIDTKLAMGLEAISVHATGFPAGILKSPSEVRQYYATHPLIMNTFDDLLVFAPDGKLIADAPELPARKALNTGDRSFFKQVIASKRAVISEPVISKIRREPIIQMAAPIMDTKGEITAVVVGVIRLYKPNFLGNLGEKKVGKTGHFSLSTTGSPAVYVAHPEKARILKPHAAGTPPAVSRALEGFEGSAEGVSRTGVPVLFTSKTLRMAPWMLLIVAPAAEVFSPIARAEDRLLVTLGFVLLLVLPVVWLLTWRALGPIVELRDTIARLRSRPAAFAPITVNRTDEFGDLTRDFNSLMDERLAAQAKQQKSESLLRLISDNTPALIAFLDRDLKYTFVNQHHTEWFGRAPAEFINRPLREVFGDEFFESVRHHYEAALKGERITFDLERKLPGSTRFTHTVLIPHMGEAGMVTGLFKLTTDVSALKQVELALKDLARRDPLTELYNRRGLDEQLTTALQRNARNGTCLALLVLDVDHFKTINDRLGHAAGDDVLQEFARRLSGCVRATDIVARIGGDEFTIVLEGLHQPAEAFEVADKILRAVEPDVITRVSKCNVTASIGIATCRRGAADAPELFRLADEAVYAAKANGRNQYRIAGAWMPSLTLVDATSPAPAKQEALNFGSGSTDTVVRLIAK